MGLSIKVRQLSLPSLGIHYAPTLVLVDRSGVVSEVWVGRLSPRQETEVMQSLQLKDTRPVSEWTIDDAELRRRIDNHEPIIVLDLREREAYTQGHLPGAKNIPFDELYVRAINELSQDNFLVLFDDNAQQADSSYTLLSDQGFSHVFILTHKTD